MNCKTSWTVSGSTVDGSSLDKGSNPSTAVTIKVTALRNDSVVETKSKTLNHAAANPAPFSLTYGGTVNQIVVIEYDEGTGTGDRKSARRVTKKKAAKKTVAKSGKAAKKKSGR